MANVEAVYTVGYDESTEDQPTLTIARREGGAYNKCVTYVGDEAKNIFEKLDIIFQSLLSD